MNYNNGSFSTTDYLQRYYSTIEGSQDEKTFFVDQLWE